MRRCLIFCILSVMLACSAQKKQVSKTDSVQNIVSTQTQTSVEDKAVDYSASPAAIIYKTKNDYYNKIPVTLNDDKTKIVSYPDPKDIYYNGHLAYPTKLDSGYLLDNRGINRNTVFLNITYYEYSKRTDVLALSEMMDMIIDKSPFIELYDCGNRYQYRDIVNDLNKVIDNKQLNKFKRIL